MMRGLWMFGALVGVSLASASCSGETGGSGSGSGGTGSTNVTTGAGFCNGTFGALVGYLDAHCSEQNKQASSYLFIYALLSSAVQECSTALQTSIDKGRASLDAQAASACVDGYKKMIDSAGDLNSLDQTITEELKQACENAIAGKQALGAPCAQSFECPDGASCVGYTNTTEGTCKAPAVGEACGQGQTNTGEGTVSLDFGNHPDCTNGYCDSTYVNGDFVKQCVALKPAGESCFDAEECQTGLRCQDGKCSTEGPAQVGGACQTTDDCTKGLYCDNQNQVCAAKKKTGETCDVGFLGGNECEGTCQGVGDSGTGTCVAFCGSG